MKLSEAIRLGAMNRPQGIGRLIADGRTCALGAAADAVGLLNEVARDGGYHALRRQWPLLMQYVPSPFGDGCEAPLLDHITALNDRHKWTREQIADFVEQIELRAEATPLSEGASIQ